MTMGVQGKNGVRNHLLKDCQEILDVYFRHGHRELDTARVYAEGTTEEYLSQLDLKGSTLDTKYVTLHLLSCWSRLIPSWRIE